MSTISEALKKAQKQRLGIQAVDEVPVSAPPPLPPLAPQKPVTVPPYASGRPSFTLILITVTILAVALIYYLRDSREKVLSRDDLPLPVTPAEVATTSPPPQGVERPLERVAMGEGRAPEAAPNQPVRVKVARTDTPVLGGIFYSVKNPVAIINGSALKEGEMAGAYRVVKILTHSVTLKCDGEEVELRLE